MKDVHNMGGTLANYVYLCIRNVDKLEEEYQTNQHWLTTEKSKTGVEIVLVHKEPKQEQRKKQVELEYRSYHLL